VWWLRGGEVERELPFIVRVWSGLLMGLDPFNRDGPFKGPPLKMDLFFEGGLSVNRF
jgi:hypothetical protein